MIVFEETDAAGVDAKGHPGKKFNVYLDGDLDEIKAHMPEDKLSTASFWGWRMFNIVKQVMAQVGAFDPNNPTQDRQGTKNH